MLGAHRARPDRRSRPFGGLPLAGLGADVILVEPPGIIGAGVTARRDTDDRRSPTFWAWNRSAAWSSTSRRRWQSRVGVLPEPTSDRVGRGTGRCRDAGRQPALVTVSISAFGDAGPRAAWPAADLTVMASGCQLAMTGDSDRPPVRTVVPQAFLHASSDAAAGALLALTARAETGRGQHVEVSAQRSILQATQSYVLAAPLGGKPAERMSGGVKPAVSTCNCSGRARTASVDRAPVRRVLGSVHPTAHAVGVRGGLLRRADA
jgi:crotonobetainyl-CoA:carnitine CoA-transferase CaiB-like acyl-CoA transferase